MKSMGKYRQCMSTGLKGKKISDPLERRKEFCVLAKMCSKAKTREEAERDCKAKHPDWWK